MYTLFAQYAIPALRLLVGSTVLTGIGYPLVVYVVGQVFFPWQADGSPVVHANGLKGSHHVGILWTDPRYVHGRPSACAYGTVPSYASNVAITGKGYRDSVHQRIQRLRVLDAVAETDIAPDMVTTSASGLDPHISPRAARQQIGRVIAARQWPLKARAMIESLITECTITSPLVAVGDSAVHVSALNKRLDELDQQFANVVRPMPARLGKTTL